MAIFRFDLSAWQRRVGGAAADGASNGGAARHIALALVLAAAVPLAACGSENDDPDEPGLGGSAGSGAGGTLSGGSSNAGSSNAGSSNAGSGGSSGAAGSGPGGAGGNTTGSGPCNVLTVESPPSSALHVTQCSELSFSTNPPSGGQHYGVWAAFQTYDFALSAGYLVHCLEHGAVVFWYNCPEGCADEVAEVQALIDALPADPLCAGTGVDRRAVLVPYPALATRWGVSAWGHALSANCVDSEAFTGFYTEHYAQGPEQLCNAGQPYTADPCQ
jgi:hypothetical protein